jgi:YggT family protein
MKPTLEFLINTFVHLFLFVMLLRFWLPFLRADFRNPIAQGILRITSPLVVPIRRVVPSIGRLDTATVVIAFAIQYLGILVILTINGVSATIAPIALTALIDLVLLTMQLFKFAIFIFVILSWVAAGAYNPAAAFIAMIVEPVLRPFRNLIPPIGMLDLSALLAIIALHAAGIFVATLRPLPI